MPEATTATGERLSALVDIENRRNRAIVERDLTFLGAVVADDVTYVHASGKLDTKASWLAGLNGSRRYLTMERGELLIRLVGDVAIMTGPAMIVFKADERSEPVTLQTYLTQVWRAEKDNGWKMIAYHGTRGSTA